MPDGGDKRGPRSSGLAGLPRPVTPAEQARRESILRTAISSLISGGEANLQMKELAARSDVSLRTLYRYFPSKDHLLLAISLRRYDDAAAQVATETPHGETPGARVEGHLLREFRSEQRYPQLTAALLKVSTSTDRAYTELIEQISGRHLDILQIVASGGTGPLAPHVQRLLPVVAHVFAAASRTWFAGFRSAAEVRTDIAIGARLLDLPSELVGAALFADPPR